VVEGTGMVESFAWSSMRWVICRFNPQVNQMQTDRVEAG
jgi:hypothetical protein